MTRHDEEVVRIAYEAFNDRDVDRAVAVMAPEVVWPDAIAGGYVHGRDGVREHWREVFEASEPRIEVTALAHRPDGKLVADVRQVVTTPDGQPVSDDRLSHVFHIHGGLIARMDVEQAAAG